MRNLLMIFIEKINCFYGSLRIRTKIMLNFLVIILLVTASASSFYYFKAASMVEDEITKTMIGILDQADINIQNIISSVEDASMSLYSNQQLREIFRRDRKHYLYRLQLDDYNILTSINSSTLTKKHITSLYFYFANGGFYTREKVNFFSIEDAKSMEWYDEAVTRNGSVIWSIDTGKANAGFAPGYYITCSRALIDYSAPENEIGYISLEISEKSLADILQRIEERIEGEIFLLNSEGQVISARDKSLIGKPFIYNKQLEELESSRLRFIRINSERENQLLMTSENNPEWKLAAVLSLEGIKKRNSEIIGFIAAITGIILAVAIFMALFLSASITGRIKELADFMGKVEIEGDNTMPVKFNDEVTELVRNFNEMLKTIRELINEVYAIKLSRKEAEIRALQEQINPHFLYNTLDSINWMANKHKAYEISRMAKLLGNFFRLSLSKGMDIVSINDEIMHVKVYVEIMQSRFDGEISVTYDVNEEILAYKTVKLVLQPVVENAILHGIQEQPEQKGNIVVKGFKREDMIILQVHDDGVGIKTEVLADLNERLQGENKDGGYGLRNVNQRIKLYFGDNYGLSVSSTYGAGTVVEIKFPACLL